MNDPMELHEAAAIGNRNLLEILLVKGHYDIDSEDWLWGMRTPLHVAAEQGQVSCVRLLLSYGADGSKRIRDGKTAAHLAAEAGHKACLIALAQHGIHLDTEDDSGATPYDLASQYGKYDCIEIISQNTSKGQYK